MNPPRSDALVVFGATGDLAGKMILPAVCALAARGSFDIPLIAVARQDADAIRRAVKDQISRYIASAPVSEITIGIDFGVELKGSAAGTLAIAAPVTIAVGPSVTFRRNDVQHAKLVFAVSPRPSSPTPG